MLNINEKNESISKQSKKKTIEFSLEIMLTMFGWFLVVWGIKPLIQQTDHTVYLGTVIVAAILLLCALGLIVYFTMKYVKRTDGKETKKEGNWLFGLFIAIFILAGMLVPIVVKPFGPTIEVTYYTAFSLGCFFLLASYLLKKMRIANK